PVTSICGSEALRTAAHLGARLPKSWMTRPRTASPISTADPFPWSLNVLIESSYAKKSVVRMSVLGAAAVGLAKIFGGRDDGGRWDALAWNSFVAWAKEVLFSAEQAYLL